MQRENEWRKIEYYLSPITALRLGWEIPSVDNVDEASWGPIPYGEFTAYKSNLEIVPKHDTKRENENVNNNSMKKQLF